MEDVLEVYHRAYEPARSVVCMDETFKQLIGEVREPMPPGPGRVERYESVYTRNGVAGVFLAFEPLGGWREAKVTDSRARVDWAHFIREMVDGRYKEAERVVLVMDQLNTPSPASLYEVFPPGETRRIADRLEVLYTLRHGSWQNMAEIELLALSRELPDRIGDRPSMVRHVGAWKGRRNGACVKADWLFTTADARTKLRKLYPTTDA